MHRITIFFFFLLSQIIVGSVPDQQQKQTGKYWVYFTDKKGVTFDPYSYFDHKTIERRIRYGNPLREYTEFTLHSVYLKSVMQLADSCGKQSRWFNAMVVFASDETVEAISKLPFVKSIEKGVETNCNMSLYPFAGFDKKTDSHQAPS